MKLRVDLRDIPPGKLDEAVTVFGENSGFLLTAWQWSAWQSTFNKQAISPRFMVMVPDFLHYARLVSTGQAKDIIKLPESAMSLIRSGITSIPTGVTELRGLAGGNFWSGAKALLAYDLGLLGGGFKGHVILHYNLGDFAWFFEKENFIKYFANSGLKQSGWGISTQQLPTALSCCSRWNTLPGTIIYTPGYSRPEALVVECARNQQFGKTSWILDLTQWPDELLTNAEVHEMQRSYDSEWLLDHSTALNLITHA